MLSASGQTLILNAHSSWFQDQSLEPSVIEGVTLYQGNEDNNDVDNDENIFPNFQSAPHLLSNPLNPQSTTPPSRYARLPDTEIFHATENMFTDVSDKARNYVQNAAELEALQKELKAAFQAVVEAHQ